MSTHVYVIAEHFDGVLRPVTLELMGKAREIADALGQEARAILLGHGVRNLASTLIAVGADRVYYADDERLANYTTDGYTEVVSGILAAEKPHAVFIGATNNGRDLAPRLSARLSCGVTADCTQLRVDEKGELLIWTRPALGGNILADIISPTARPQMGTVRPNVFPRPHPDTGRKGEVMDVPVMLPADAIRTKQIRFERILTDGVNLEDAEIIIGGGRGMGSAEAFQRLHELAKLLGGSVAATRAAVEAGWAPTIHQVGQTGKHVGPKIYFAFGISGAIQHMAGIGGADLIVAINTDPEAPIFAAADYGIVGDVHDVLEAFIAAAKRGELR